MTRRRDPLDQALADLELLCKKVQTGTAARPSTVRVIDLAFSHMRDWADTRPVRLEPEGPRGGSSSPVEIGERLEDQKVGRNALADHATALTLVKTICTAAERLHALTIRYTKPIDHTKLPTADDLAGCVSCARVKRKGPVSVGGHFAPVDVKNYPREQLCRFCGDYARGDAQLRRLPPVELEDGSTRKAMGDFPPVEACDVLHMQGAPAAGRWLARQPAGRPARKQTQEVR